MPKKYIDSLDIKLDSIIESQTNQFDIDQIYYTQL